MQIENIKQTLASKKGANLKATWGKALKTRKDAAGYHVQKVTTMVVRGGIDYDNMKVVQEGREDGSLPSENAGLPWGEWAEFPLHITHKGTDYARFYPASGINVATGGNFIPEVTFYINGQVATREDAQRICRASEFPKREEAPLCFTIKAENVVSLG